jgi:hypothetical protein
VIATLLFLVAGCLLLGLSVKRSVFVRLVGPAINAQYRLSRKLPNLVDVSERSYLSTARILCIVFGALLLAFGLAGVVVLA